MRTWCEHQPVHARARPGHSSASESPGLRRFGADVFVPHLLELYMQGRFPFDRLVQFYDFDQINQAAADTESGATVKPILRIACSTAYPRLGVMAVMPTPRGTPRCCR